MHVFDCFIIFILKVTYEKEPCFILTFNKLFLNDFFFIRGEILRGHPVSPEEGTQGSVGHF